MEPARKRRRVLERHGSHYATGRTAIGYDLRAGEDDGLGLVSESAEGRIVAGIATVDGDPLVGAGGEGQDTGGRDIDAVAVNWNDFSADHGGAQEEREGDGAGGIEAAREQGGVSQTGAAADHDGAA